MPRSKRMMFDVFVFKYSDITNYPSKDQITAEILPSLSKDLECYAIGATEIPQEYGFRKQ